MRKALVYIISVFLLADFFIVNYIVSPVYSLPERSLDVPVDIERIKNDVYLLTNTPEPRNSFNIQSLNLAADYIKQEFSNISDRVEEQVYQVENNDFRNIICSFGPEEGERVIVGAHYDVCHEQPGADDNASGVAGLLELARILKVRSPEHRIDLVAYSLEEPPFFKTPHMGSYVHAKYLKDNEIPVKAMISLEMIGYFSEEEDSQDFPFSLMKLLYPTKGNFIAVVGKVGQRSLTKKVKTSMISASAIPVKSINAPKFVQGIDFSDHLNYWIFGYPAIMITNTSFYRNKNYHEKTDTPETLDYEKMAEVIKGCYRAIVEL
ncbi:M28 family peptidase [Cytophagaceae bacterium ABcell3]|nr:M28 family peptidase [Cytophagaceae bacterium ABcell3]